MADIQKNLWPGWETVKLIGKGSFGAVYEIQRDMLGEIEKAALKVISIPQNDSDIEEMYSDGYNEESITSTFHSYLKSIIGEYALMRKLNGCANIVSCDDVRYVQHDDGIGWDVYIKMELLTPLTKALPSEVSEETVIQIAKDLCEALVLCKKHDIVHRDIKPQNIFISPNGDYKLGDFGIAKTVEKTTGGTKIGTYKYMAPEVYHSQPYGSASDIYSLGLVLYWLLNERRMPFLPLPPEPLRAGMDEHARMRRLSGEPIPAPLHGSDGLKAIVLKACAFDPKDRYQTAAEMLQNLQSMGSTPVSFKQKPAAPVYGTPTPIQPTVAVVSDTWKSIQEVASEDATMGIWNQALQNQPPVQNTTEESAIEDATMGIWEQCDPSANTMHQVATPKVAAEPVSVANTAHRQNVTQENIHPVPLEKQPKKGTPKKKNNLIPVIAASVAVLVAIVAILVITSSTPASNHDAENSEIRYNEAVALMDAGQYEQAAAFFEALGDYKNCQQLATECQNAQNYNQAIALMNAGQYSDAIAIFEKQRGYKDSNAKISECNIALNYEKAMSLMNSGAFNDALSIFEQQSEHADSAAMLKECTDALNYYQAISLMNNGQYREAAPMFMKAHGYNDSAKYLRTCFSSVKVTIDARGGHTVGLKHDGTVVAVGWNDPGQCEVAQWNNIVAIAGSAVNTVGLKADGTVVAVGSRYEGQCNVADWKNIVAIVAGLECTVGLKADGSVVAVGMNDDGQCDVSGWKDIIAITTGAWHTVGLKADGTTVAVGNNFYGQCEVSGWNDIVAIVADSNNTAGLKADGTVVAVGNNQYGQCNVSGWTDIVAISAGMFHTVGLKADGTVVAVGDNQYGQCNVSGWTDIVAISASRSHTVGLKADGTVVAIGNNDFGQCDVSGWTDIVAISVGDVHTVGLKADGSVVAIGNNNHGQCDVSGWKNILVPR